MSDGVRSKIETLGVVGAGPMGCGIAQVALVAGLRVLVHDQDAAMMRAAEIAIRERLKRLADRGVAVPDAAQIDRQWVAVTDLAGLAPADAVIEAIVERLEPKQALLASLQDVVGSDVLLATNTSSLSVAAIAKRCRNPTRVVGMHFFNPVPVMRLVEIVHSPMSCTAAVEVAAGLARRFGKTAVQVKDAPGFLVNLGGRALTTEALHIEAEGVAPIATIDRIMRDGCGFPLGPFELMDLTGIDVNFPVTNYIWEGYQEDPRLKTAPLHAAMFNSGRFGRKTGLGFYDPSPARDPAPASVTTVLQPLQLSAFIPEGKAQFASLASSGLIVSDGPGQALTLIEPIGEDATAVVTRLGLDPTRTVALDTSTLSRRFVTLMAPPGPASGRVMGTVEQWLISRGFSVAVVKDSPGFVAPRIWAMIANLGCEMAQLGLATPEDIDVAMRLGLNYPLGPLEAANHMGLPRVYQTLQNLQQITGSDRYRPSQWVRRRALLNLTAHVAD